MGLLRCMSRCAYDQDHTKFAKGLTRETGRRLGGCRVPQPSHYPLLAARAPMAGLRAPNGRGRMVGSPMRPERVTRAPTHPSAERATLRHTTQ